jgi:AraC-like DNA-binding protein
MHSTYSDPIAAEPLPRMQWDADGGIRIELLGLVDFPSGYQGALHSHPFWELIFIAEGQGQVLAAGDVRSCSAGDLLLMRPGEKHQFRSGVSASLEQLYLGFSCDFGMPEKTERVLPPGPFTELIKAELRETLELLKDNGGGPAVDSIRARLLPLAGRVIGFLSARENPAAADGRPYQSLIREAKECLRADLGGNPSVPALARRFCLSPHYFGEIFKRETGLSIKEYQRHLRLDRALEKLRDTGLSVSEIAAEVGLEDVAYFSRLFKRHYGISPRQARTKSYF